MKLIRRVIAISPVALPALALVAYFALMPVPPAYAEKPILCYYAGKGYSGGANIADNCSGGGSQTCGAGGTWSACH